MPRRKLLKSRVARPTRKGLLLASLLHSTNKTANFNPLTALARSYMGGKRKRKAPRRAGPPSKRGKMAVRSMPKFRIGSNAGLIVSNQKVPRPRAGSVQYRRSVFGSVSAQDKLWLGGSSIGTEGTHFRTVAQAILIHYMNQMGDYRATNDAPAAGVFSRFKMTYGMDAPASFATPPVVPSTFINDGTIKSMATSLGLQMAAEAGKGFYPVSIAFDTPDQSGHKLEDKNLGRHSVTVSCKGRFRFQNVTEAEGEHGNNINAIDANPVSGKIYTFKNQSPIFTPSYVEAASAAVKDGIRELNTVSQSFELYATTVSPATAGKGGAAFVEPAPPLNPSSIWRNVSSTGNVAFPPWWVQDVHYVLFAFANYF